MEKKDYQFVQVPINLFILLDNNCRSMLFTLIQLSTYYAEEDGWFFRTYADLEAESNLSKNLVEATIQTLFNHYLIEAKPTGQGKGKKANYYKVNFEEFTRYEEYSIEDCMKNPDLKIRTVEYKGSHFKLNLVREKVEEVVNNVVTKVVKSDNNINNIYNKNNIYNIENNNINKNNNILEEKENIINNIKEKEKLDSTEFKNEVEDNDKIFNTMLGEVGKDKFKLLEEFIEDTFRDKKTYQESVSQIGVIFKWIKERYSEKHNVEMLTRYANNLISNKLEVFKTVS